jgi:hypothetical protein
MAKPKHRVGPTMTCPDCQSECPRTGSKQIRCPSCQVIATARRKRQAYLRRFRTARGVVEPGRSVGGGLPGTAEATPSGARLCIASSTADLP